MVDVQIHARKKLANNLNVNVPSQSSLMESLTVLINTHVIPEKVDVSKNVQQRPVKTLCADATMQILSSALT